MKQLLSSYSISGNVVTLTGVDRPKEAILSITDATTGAILYTAQTGGASAYSKNDAGSGNSKITLTTTPGASDRLQIFYDDGVAPANAPTSVSVSNFPSSTEISNDVGNPIPISASSLPLPSGAAQDGTDGTGITAPTGGSGIRGWLSGIYSKLSSALAVTQSGTWSIGRTWTLGSGTDSVTVQGGNSTAVKVDGSAVTQPVSLASVPSHPVTNAGTFAVQPSAGDLTSGSQTTKIVNGANTLAVDSTGALTANAPANTVTTSYSLTGAQTAGSAILVSSTNVSSYRAVTIQCTSVGVGGTWQAQISLDGTTWFPTTLLSYGGGGVTSTFSATGAWELNLNAVYFRIALVSNNQTSGTTTVFLSFSQQPVSHVWQSNQFNSPLTPSAGIGFSSFHTNNSAASINATNVKSSAGTIGSLILSNTTASWRWFLIVNKASAPVSGTDTPVLAIGIPPNSTVDCSVGYSGLRLTSGISYYISASNTFTGASSSSTPSAVGAGEVNVYMTYV